MIHRVDAVDVTLHPQLEGTLGHAGQPNDQLESTLIFSKVSTNVFWSGLTYDLVKTARFS